MENGAKPEEPLLPIPMEVSLPPERIEEQAKAIFPLEVWEHIFGFVDLELTPTDFMALVNTSPEWRLVLKRSVTSALLPLVLPLVLEYLDASEKPLLKNVLSWRRINKNVKNSVDQILSSISTSPRKYYERKSERNVSRWNSFKTISKLQSLIHIVDKRNHIWSSGNLHSLLRHFGNDDEAKCNPFLTRTVELKINPYMVNDEQRLHSLLVRYGHNISALTIKMEGTLPLDTVHRLMSLLRRVPNIKVLKLGDYFGVDWYEGGGDDGRITPVNFPNLNDLQCLDWSFTDEERFFRLGLQFVEQYGQQLHTLICGVNFLQTFDVTTLNSLLPNVRCLRVGLVRCQDLYHLDTFTHLDWPLEELQLSSFHTSVKNSVVDFFCSISKFAPTLAYLQIFSEFPIHEDFKIQCNPEFLLSVNGLMMIHHSVKKLSTLLTNIHSAWFKHVVPTKFPNLEELNLYNSLQQDDLEDLKIIFSTLPNLKRIVIFHYRRKNSNEQLDEPRKLILKR
ncbi:hypothetical protein Ocin01_16275 [Orchesella cincta]|uniref:Uncharacterized protein n=1 Tax=Orchesella cincta TaxID=48709 RepID=A0A1D2MBU7_ORCCI|nr:hypothetical protein Ocin01_16275 [Orchesella cincta]